MDHDNKVKSTISQGKEIFLHGGALIEEPSKPQLYSLEDEFAKTKKNKNMFFYFGLMGFIVLVVIGTVLFTYYLERQSQAVNVNFDEFEDIRLKELLSQAQDIETRLKKAERELEELKVNLKKDVDKALDAGNKQIDLLRLSGSESEITRVRNQTDSRVASIRYEYGVKIKDKENEIVEIKKKMATMDQRALDEARKSQEAINNQRKIMEIELDKQRKYYEEKIAEVEKKYNKEITFQNQNQGKLIPALVLRYNPIFEEGRVRELISVPVPEDKKRPKLLEYREELNRERIWSKANFNKLRERINDRFLVMNRLQEIPYTNSVPDSFNQLNFLFSSIVGEYERVWSDMIEVINKKNEIISRYEYGLSALAKERRENGFIIDPRNGSNLVVFIDNIYTVKEGDVALVFRTDDEYIGKIKLIPTRDFVRAEVVELNGGAKIKAFDKILLQLQ